MSQSNISRSEGMSTVTRQETGESRELNADELTAAHRVLGEKVYEQTVRTPKRVVTEQLLEDVVVLPRKVVRESIVEVEEKRRERVVEVGKPRVVERVVEVPEIEYVEKIVEVPQEVVQERIMEMPVAKYEERWVDVAKMVETEDEEIEYRAFDVEKIVEVLEYRDEVVDKEVPIDQAVEVEVPEFRDVDHEVTVERRIPVGMRSAVSHHFKLPRLKPKYKKIPLPIYAPRFIEVPVPFSFMDEEQKGEAARISECMSLIAENQYPSLTELEKLAEAAKAKKFTFLEDRGDLAAVLHKQVAGGHMACNVSHCPAS